jgi:S1-C subfamily serine protease
MRTPRTLLVVAAASILGGAAGTGVAIGLRDDGSTTTTTVHSATTASDGPSLSAREIYRSAADSVAYITARGTQGSATGTGFVVDANGLIVTNEHVVDGSSDITVKLGDGKAQRAEVVGQDKSTDLALLKIDTGGAKLTPLKLADSSKVQIGDATFAIGNPFGLEDTLTTGVVSATERRISAPDGFSIDGVLQTDAALNPGNSGGALVDGAGRVVGINTAVAGVGLGLAVPINEATRRIVAVLMADGRVRRAWLGVAVGPRPLPPRVAGRLDRDRAIEVIEIVEGSPADHAGLRPEDLLIELDGVPLNATDDLQRLMTAERIDEPVKATVVREGELRAITLVPRELPE